MCICLELIRGAATYTDEGIVNQLWAFPTDNTAEKLKKFKLVEEELSNTLTDPDELERLSYTVIPD